MKSLGIVHKRCREPLSTKCQTLSKVSSHGVLVNKVHANVEGPLDENSRWRRSCTARPACATAYQHSPHELMVPHDATDAGIVLTWHIFTSGSSVEAVKALTATGIQMYPSWGTEVEEQASRPCGGSMSNTFKDWTVNKTTERVIDCCLNTEGTASSVQWRSPFRACVQTSKGDGFYNMCGVPIRTRPFCTSTSHCC